MFSVIKLRELDLNQRSTGISYNSSNVFLPICIMGLSGFRYPITQ